MRRKCLMNFNKHYALEGKHAFLSASQYHWLNYDEEKLIERYSNWQAAQRGTEFHALAAQLISMGVKLPRNKKTFNAYVNDGIGFKMTPEQPRSRFYIIQKIASEQQTQFHLTRIF